MGRIRNFRRAIRRSWKQKPGLWPWLMSLPTRGTLFVLRLMPSRLALAVADTLGRLAWLSARRRRCGREQIRRALPELSTAQSDRLLRQSCGHLGRSVAETMVVLQRFRGRGLENCFDFEDGAREQYLAVAGQAPVLVQAHLGAFEAFGAAVASLGLDPGFTMRLPTNYYVGKRLVDSRAGWGIELFPRHGAVRRMLGHMKKGGAVVLATDQNAHHAPVFVPWFGKLAATERAAAAIALRTGAPVLVCWCVRSSVIGRYRVGCTTLRGACVGQKATEQATLELTLQMHQALEPVIREHPEQYLWVHDRYRTRPGEND
jgi:Kdo2-lipid IVA lauroyltransferase/acyltransferase